MNNVDCIRISVEKGDESALFIIFQERQKTK